MPLQTKRVGDAIVLYLEGNLSRGEQAEELRGALEAFIEEGKRLLVVNCRDLLTITPTPLCILLSAHSSLKKVSGELRLCCAGETVKKTLLITQLNTVFEVFETEEEAIAGTSMGAHHGA